MTPSVRWRRLVILGLPLLLNSACASLRPVDQSALGVADIARLSSTTPFVVMVRHDPATGRHEPCAARDVTARVLRVSADTIHFSSLLQMDSVATRESACLTVVPGYAIIDRAAPPRIETWRMNGKRTAMTFSTIIVGFAVFIFLAFNE